VLQRPLDELGSLRAAKLASDSSPMQLGGPNRDAERARDLPIRLTAGEQRQDFTLAVGERSARGIDTAHDRDDVTVLVELERSLIETARANYSRSASVAERDLQPRRSVRPLHLYAHARSMARGSRASHPEERAVRVRIFYGFTRPPPPVSFAR
jgi:hypothetical protein